MRYDFQCVKCHDVQTRDIKKAEWEADERALERQRCAVPGCDGDALRVYEASKVIYKGNWFVNKGEY